MLNRTPLMGISVHSGSSQDFFCAFEALSSNRKSTYVCFVNVHMFVEAKKNADFASIINNADIACPDGHPLAKSLSWFYGIRQKRIAGPDCLPSLLSLSERSGKRIFILGSIPNVINAFVSKVHQEYPKATICGTFSPPFRPLTPDEDESLVSLINESKADMIFVVLGCPKQEKWMAAHKGKVHGAMFGIGYAIPVYAGIERRAPQWMRSYGLEWFYRLLQDPRRLWKRYFITNTIFIVRIILEKIRECFLDKRKKKR